MKLICALLLALSLTACKPPVPLKKGEVYIVIKNSQPHYVTLMVKSTFEYLVKYHDSGELVVVKESQLFKVGDIFPDKEK